MQCKVFFYEILYRVTLRCVLCYNFNKIEMFFVTNVTNNKFNSDRLICSSKRHARIVCIFNKKEFFFSNENKIIIQNDYKEKGWSAYKIWKNHSFRKCEYSSAKRLLKKIRETGSYWFNKTWFWVT